MLPKIRCGDIKITSTGDLELDFAIIDYLLKPKPRRITLADHGPMDLLSSRCLGCNRTVLELYSTTLMPMCREIANGE